MKANDTLTPDVLAAAGWRYNECSNAETVVYDTSDDTLILFVGLSEYNRLIINTISKVALSSSKNRINLQTERVAISVGEFNTLLDIANLPQFKIPVQ